QDLVIFDVVESVGQQLVAIFMLLAAQRLQAAMAYIDTPNTLGLRHKKLSVFRLSNAVGSGAMRMLTAFPQEQPHRCALEAESPTHPTLSGPSEQCQPNRCQKRGK